MSTPPEMRNNPEKKSFSFKVKLKKIFTGFLVALIWVGIWQIISMIVGKELLIPRPESVFCELFRLAGRWAFWETVLISMARIIYGYLLGIIGGIILASLSYAIKPVRLFLNPARLMISSTPIASFIILALIWIKNQNIPIFITFLMVLPVVWGNVFKGLEETDKKLLEMTQVYKLGFVKTIRFIYLRQVLPYFAAGAATSMALAWKAGIAAEVLSLPKKGIGYEIYNSKLYLEIPGLFAWSIVVIIISILLEKIIKVFLNKYEIKKAEDKP